MDDRVSRPTPGGVCPHRWAKRSLFKRMLIRMNATMISPVYPLRGGIAESGILLHRALFYPFNIRTISYKRLYPKFLFPGKSEFIDIPHPRADLHHRCKLDALNPFNWFKVARSIKTDVVIIRYWTPALALCIGTLAWLLRKKKLIFIVDNVVPHEKFPFSKLLTKYALRQGDGFIFFSHYVAKDFFVLIAKGWRIDLPKVAVVVSMPIINVSEKIISKKEARDIIWFKDDDKVILFFGLIREYKGLDILIKAMPDILKEVDVKLMVVGEFYDDVGEYRDLISELGLLNNVNIVNEYVEKVAPYFCAADVVVLPYKHATQSAVVRLAQYFKKPCIVTDVGGLSEMVTIKTGSVVGEDRIAESVIDFYKKPNR